MKLLYDHNLPPLLVSRLADLFPHSQHVFALGLDQVSDAEIRDYARQNDFCIVLKYSLKGESMRLTEMVSCSG